MPPSSCLPHTLTHQRALSILDFDSAPHPSHPHPPRLTQARRTTSVPSAQLMASLIPEADLAAAGEGAAAGDGKGGGGGGDATAMPLSSPSSDLVSLPKADAAGAPPPRPAAAAAKAVGVAALVPGSQGDIVNKEAVVAAAAVAADGGEAGASASVTSPPPPVAVQDMPMQVCDSREQREGCLLASSMLLPFLFLLLLAGITGTWLSRKQNTLVSSCFPGIPLGPLLHSPAILPLALAPSSPSLPLPVPPHMPSHRISLQVLEQLSAITRFTRNIFSSAAYAAAGHAGEEGLLGGKDAEERMPQPPPQEPTQAQVQVQVQVQAQAQAQAQTKAGSAQPQQQAQAQAQAGVGEGGAERGGPSEKSRRRGGRRRGERAGKEESTPVGQFELLDAFQVSG